MKAIDDEIEKEIELEKKQIEADIEKTHGPTVSIQELFDIATTCPFKK